MILTSGTAIKNLLEKYTAKPFKGFGQNFLVNKGVLEKIIKTADLSSADIILEIGPGIGTLTQELAKKAGKIFAIEKDKKMAEILKETLKNFKNVEIINADALKINPDSFLDKNPYKVVANLPYNIASAVIKKLLESEKPPEEMILMVQKEVAKRICAKPPDMNLLAVSVQFYSNPEILFYVSKNAFWPKPKVDGAIIKITYLNNFRRNVLRKLFFKIVKAGFSHPRKQILNNLSKVLKLNKERVKKWLSESNIQPTKRAETLSMENWLELIKNLREI